MVCPRQYSSYGKIAELRIIGSFAETSEHMHNLKQHRENNYIISFSNLVIASVWDIFPHYYKHVSLFVTMATTCALPLNKFCVCKKHLYT